jgi:hypothetical protein
MGVLGAFSRGRTISLPRDVAPIEAYTKPMKRYIEKKEVDYGANKAQSSNRQNQAVC